MVESHEPEPIQQLDTIYNTYNTYTPVLKHSNG
jgi:hypothetical protein